MDDHLEGHPSATDTGQGLEDPGKGKCRGRDGGVANRLWPSTREPSTLGGSVQCVWSVSRIGITLKQRQMFTVKNSPQKIYNRADQEGSRSPLND